MRFILTPLVCLFTTSLSAQSVNWKNVEAQNADRILIDPAKPPVKTLLLGSFHFGYPNLDAHKTDSSKMIDVLSPSRQKEIRQLVDVVASFKPTKIYIESKNQRRTDSLYNAYLAGAYKLDRDERDQIAFRLAAELKLPKLYAVDAYDFTDDYYDKSKVFDSLFNSGVLTDSVRDRSYNRRYRRMYDAADSTELVNTILESFLVMAESLTLRRMHGHYLAGGFNTTTYSGPDKLLLWWYSRNLRIYNNILNTRPASGDRILVLFGNGHMPILKHCFESSPEFELVPLKELVLKMEKAGKLK